MNTTIFWAQVQPTGFCWLWTGRTHDGYGRYSGGSSHRIAYELLVGPIPDGLELDHLCRVTQCVNPDHLEPVTREENIRRRYLLVTSCKNGHPFTPENTYPIPPTVRRSGKRACRTCRNEASQRYRTRRAA